MSGCPGIRQAANSHYVTPCGKLPMDDRDPYCPKHRVMMNGQDHENARRMEKARRGKERKKLAREALAESPLRAYNPKFDEKRRNGYENG